MKVSTKLFNIELSRNSSIIFKIKCRDIFLGHANIQPLSDIEHRINQLSNYHSTNNKQKFGYNPFASEYTADLVISYSAFSSNNIYEIKEYVNLYLNEVFGGIVSFLQRRKITIFPIDIFPTDDKLIFAMPVAPCFMAVANTHSIGYGKLTVNLEHMDKIIIQAIYNYEKLSDEKKEILKTILRRYQDMLILPYCYERAEAIWKMIEALSKTQFVQEYRYFNDYKIENDYKNAKSNLNMSNNSKTLKRFVSTMSAFSIGYQYNDLKNAFLFRNDNTHDFLKSDLIYSDVQRNAFCFLICALEKIIFKMLSLDEGLYSESGYLIMMNKIL